MNDAEKFWAEHPEEYKRLKKLAEPIKKKIAEALAKK